MEMQKGGGMEMQKGGGMEMQKDGGVELQQGNGMEMQQGATQTPYWTTRVTVSVWLMAPAVAVTL